MQTGVGVEKHLPAKFAKIKLRQEAPQSIFSGRVDIFYLPNFGCLRRKGSFSTATPDCDSYGRRRRYRVCAQRYLVPPLTIRTAFWLAFSRLHLYAMNCFWMWALTCPPKSSPAEM